VTGGDAVAKKPGVKVADLNKLTRKLKQYEGAVEDLKAAHKSAADLVAAAARPLVPRRTGTLAGTLRTSGTTRGGRVAAGRKSVPYAGPVHFGWPSRPNPAKGWRGGPIRPNPFIYDALDRRRAEVEGQFERYLLEVQKRYNL
jgi:hypothetical protein